MKSVSGVRILMSKAYAAHVNANAKAEVSIGSQKDNMGRICIQS